jgi:hypothetical protein
MPVYCYVDECQDYFAGDENIGKFLDKARKRRVGMILATQRLDYFTPGVKNALLNTAIHFNATGQEKARGVFKVSIRRETEEPVEIQTSKRAVSKLGRMSDEDFELLQADMRWRYGAEGTEPPPQNRKPVTEDEYDITPSKSS